MGSSNQELKPTSGRRRLAGKGAPAPVGCFTGVSLLHNAPNVQALYDAIKERVTFCEVVLIMAGVYATYSKWIQREIRIAKVDFNKPIVAVRPWGNTQVSTIVRNNADRLVNWNTSSVVLAIREVAP